MPTFRIAEFPSLALQNTTHAARRKSDADNTPLPTLSIPPSRKHQHQDQSITVFAAAAVEKLLTFTNYESHEQATAINNVPDAYLWMTQVPDLGRIIRHSAGAKAPALNLHNDYHCV
jgi:hypothetical protein